MHFTYLTFAKMKSIFLQSFLNPMYHTFYSSYYFNEQPWIMLLNTSSEKYTNFACTDISLALCFEIFFNRVKYKDLSFQLNLNFLLFQNLIQFG